MFESKVCRPMWFLSTIAIRWCDLVVTRGPRVKRSCYYLIFCRSAWDYRGKNNAQVRNTVGINWIFIFEFCFVNISMRKYMLSTFWKCYRRKLMIFFSFRCPFTSNFHLIENRQYVERLEKFFIKKSKQKTNKNETK